MKGASRKPMVLLGLLLAVLLGLGGRAPAADTALTVTGAEAQVGGVWDTGALTISFTDSAGNSYSETVSPGQFSTAASIASAFGAKFSNQYYITPFQAGHTPLLSAHAVGCTIYFHLAGTDTFPATPSRVPHARILGHGKPRTPTRHRTKNPAPPSIFLQRIISRWRKMGSVSRTEPYQPSIADP